MRIIEFLETLAQIIPGSEKAEMMIKNQPKEIQIAIEKNDSTLIKKFISNNDFFPNETLVTLY